MDFLALAQRTRQECGVTGSQTTVSGATGEWKRICDWVSQAWLEIQLMDPDWQWMRKTATVNTIASVSEYTPADFGITDFASWRERSFRIYLTSAGIGSEWLLPHRDYNSFRDYYLLSSRKTTYARPAEMTISPSKSVLLGLGPNDVYTVTGEYFSTPIKLTNDTDTPAMPARFHTAIVYLAMQFYAGYEAAPEVMARGREGYRKMMARLQIDQGAGVKLGGSLI